VSRALEVGFGSQDIFAKRLRVLHRETHVSPPQSEAHDGAKPATIRSLSSDTPTIDMPCNPAVAFVDESAIWKRSSGR